MKIDLGMSYHGVATPMKMADEHYPTLTYDGPQEVDLPEEGVMKIRYKKVRSSKSTDGGREIHSCTIEAREILSVKATKAEAEDEMPAKSYDEAGDALDRLMSEKMAGKKSKSEAY